MAGKLLFPRSKIKNLITGNKKLSVNMHKFYLQMKDTLKIQKMINWKI